MRISLSDNSLHESQLAVKTRAERARRTCELGRVDRFEHLHIAMNIGHSIGTDVRTSNSSASTSEDMRMRERC